MAILGAAAAVGWTLLLSAALTSGGAEHGEPSLPALVEGESFSEKFDLDESLAPWADEFLKPYHSAPGAMAPGAGSPSSFVLAAKRTRRPDVLDKFRTYTGGWNISSKHYWASVGFTGASGFILALLWFVSFGLALAAYYCCKRRKSIRRTDSFISWPIMIAFLLTFTCVAVTGCILLVVGQEEFHSEVMDTLRFVVNQSDFTVQILRNVTDYLLLTKTINVGRFYLPLNVQGEVDKLNIELNSTASALSEKTVGNSRKIKHVFSEVRIALFVVATIMLMLAVLGFLLSVRGHKRAIYVFILAGWMLVAITFILCGVFVILNNVIGDTCTSMDEWVHDPRAELALSDLLFCVDERTANQTLYRSRAIVVQLVKVINTAISSIANSNGTSPRGNAYFYNQSGPQMPYLCAPYDSSGSHYMSCNSQEVSLANASSVWRGFECAVSSPSSSGYCAGAGRVTPAMYGQLAAAVNASFALDHYAPLLLSLQDCKFVREAFAAITTRFCPRLKLELRMVDAGLALISTGTMLCLVSWMFCANRPRREEEFVFPSQTKVTEG